MAVHQDASGHARDVAMSYACGLGGGRSGIIKPPPAVMADLFGEKAVMYGGVVSLSKPAMKR